MSDKIEIVYGMKVCRPELMVAVAPETRKERLRRYRYMAIHVVKVMALIAVFSAGIAMMGLGAQASTAVGFIVFYLALSR